MKHRDAARACRRRSGLGYRGTDCARVFKYFYLASFTSYYTFYLITRFHVGGRSSQIHLFIFLEQSPRELVSADPSAIVLAARP